MIRGVLTHSPFIVRRRTAGNSFDLVARKETMSQTLLIPGLSALNPMDLFRNGQPGGFADPYDLTKMWVDDAGTTPMTIANLGTGIGRVIAKGHTPITLTQATSGDRPVWGRHPVSGIRNLLTDTAAMSTQSIAVAASQHTLSFQGTGTVTLSGASTAGPLVGTGASDIVSLTFTPTAASLTLTVSGTVELAQLELGASRTTYQRVTNRFDITEVGSPSLYYFDFNGVSQAWTSNATVNFSTTNRMTIWGGLHKRSDVSAGRWCSLGVALPVGGFIISAPPNPGSTSAGSAVRGATASAFRHITIAAPATYTQSVEFNLAGATNPEAVRNLVNGGGTVTNSGNIPGGGNFANAVLQFGRDGTSTDPFNGRLYTGIVAGAAYDSRTVQRFAEYTLKPRRLITA